MHSSMGMLFLRILTEVNSLAVQWLRLCAFTAKGLGSIPVRELRSHKLHNVAKMKLTLN